MLVHRGWAAEKLWAQLVPASPAVSSSASGGRIQLFLLRVCVAGGDAHEIIGATLSSSWPGWRDWGGRGALEANWSSR